MEKVIALAGQADHDNFGDSLIFAMYLRMISATQPEYKVVVFKPSDIFVQRLKDDGLAVVEIGKLESSWSALIFVPGGYFGASDITNPFWQIDWLGDGYIKDLLTYAGHSRLRTLVHGVEIGPLMRPFASKVLQNRLAKIKDLTLTSRNPESTRYATSVLTERCDTLFDFVTAVPAYYPMRVSKDFDIGIHATKKVFSNNIMAKRFSRTVTEAIRKLNYRTVLIFSDQTMSDEIMACASDFAASLSLHGISVEIRDYLGIKTTLQNITSCRMVLTSKLHVGVCALSYGIKAISISSHPKLVRFYRAAKLTQFNCHYFLSSQQSFLQLLVSVGRTTEDDYFSNSNIPAPNEVINSYSSSLARFISNGHS